MESLQQEIEDERKAKLQHFPYRTGVGSLSCWGSLAGLAVPGFTAADFRAVFRHEPIRVVDIRMSPVASDRPQIILNPPRAVVVRSSSQGFRERELEWRRTHAMELRRYENEWVVLEGEEIISHGSDPAQVVQEAKARGIRKPYVFFVERQNENVITIGL